MASRDTAAAAAAAKLMAAACAKVSDHDAARHGVRVRRSLKRALEEASGGEPSAR